MADKKTNTEAVRDYHNKLDNISIRVPKGYKQVMKDYAETQNISLNQLVIRAVENDAKENGVILNIPSGIKEMKADNK